MSGVEAIALGASVVAIIQITDRIIGLCKFYLGNAKDAPSELRTILLETLTLKTILENLEFLSACDHGSTALRSLADPSGPIEGCRKSLAELEKLFPSDHMQAGGMGQDKRRKITVGLAWPLKEKKANRLLAEISRYKETISLALTTDSVQDIKVIKTRASEIHTMLTDKQRQDIYQWLQTTDPSPLHYRARGNHEPGTGKWLLRSPEWTNWLDAKQRCLWIHGIPGAGKTVLMSSLIEDIKRHCTTASNSKIVCLYYYCYFGHNQDEAVPFLRWLLSQLCRQADRVSISICEMHKYGGQPSLTDLLRGITEILDAFTTVYVVLDAIDESIPREELLGVLRHFLTDRQLTKIQLLASSREYKDIERVMQPISVSMSMANSFLEEDIRAYVRSSIHSDQKFNRWPQDLLGEAERVIPTQARGMFRWAVCQLDVLRRLKCERHIVEKALSALPRTLFETYERIFLAIPEEERHIVHHTLSWISFHGQLHDRPLCFPILLRLVLRSTAYGNSAEKDHFYDEATLQELCGCLINVIPPDPESTGASVVTFAHYTVSEYLVSADQSSSSTALCFIPCGKDLERILMSAIFSEVASTVPHELRAEESTGCEGVNSQDAQRLRTGSPEDLILHYFKFYCRLSVIGMLITFQESICLHDTLITLAIGILDPSKSCLQALIDVGGAMSDTGKEEWCLSRDVAEEDLFWQLDYDLPSNAFAPKMKAIHLLNFFHLSSWGTGENLLLARFLERLESRDLLTVQFTFTRDVVSTKLGHTGYESVTFDGTIIEAAAQLASQNSNYLSSFSLLLDCGAGLFNPSEILVLFIGTHNHYWCAKTGKCPLEQLLTELGANAQSGGYRVTLLQIAVACADLVGVNMLLKAGADPNLTGEINAIAREKGTFLHRFNHLHGATPLYICREFEMFREFETFSELDYFDKENQKQKLDGIEAALLLYGARAFLESSDGPASPSGYDDTRPMKRIAISDLIDTT